MSDSRSYWPMRIVEGGQSVGFRIGGAPPINVIPKQINDQTQYFATFPISRERDLELSMFCSFEYENPESPFHIARKLGRPIGQESGVIQCVFHEPSPRGNDARLASELAAYGIDVGSEGRENFESGMSGSPHKIGGKPFLYPKFREISDDILKSGYCHLMQWVFPGKGDCLVKGLWPFSNFHFHLYLKASDSGYDFKALLV